MALRQLYQTTRQSKLVVKVYFRFRQYTNRHQQRLFTPTYTTIHYSPLDNSAMLIVVPFSQNKRLYHKKLQNYNSRPPKHNGWSLGCAIINTTQFTYYCITIFTNNKLHHHQGQIKIRPGPISIGNGIFSCHINTKTAVENGNFTTWPGINELHF